MTDFPTISFSWTGEIPFIYLKEVWLEAKNKKVPLSGGAFPYRPLWGVTPRLESAAVRTEPLGNLNEILDNLKKQNTQ